MKNKITQTETISFTVVHPVDAGNGYNREVLIKRSNKGSYYTLQLQDGTFLDIDHQQLFELGILFTSLADPKLVDHDSALELLDGFDLNLDNIHTFVKLAKE